MKLDWWRMEPSSDGNYMLANDTTGVFRWSVADGFILPLSAGNLPGPLVNTNVTDVFPDGTAVAGWVTWEEDKCCNRGILKRFFGL